MRTEAKNFIGADLGDLSVVKTYSANEIQMVKFNLAVARLGTLG